MRPRNNTRARRPAEHCRPRAATAAPASAALRPCAFSCAGILQALGLPASHNAPAGAARVYPPTPALWRRRVRHDISNRNITRLEPHLTLANSTREPLLTATKPNIAIP